MDATGVPRCGGGGESLLPSGDSECLVVVPVVAQTDGSVGEHRQGSCQALTHAGSVQAVFHDVTAGTFDDTARDRVAVAQVVAIVHAMSVFLEVRYDRVDGLTCLSTQAVFALTAFAQHLPQAADHSAQIAVQHASHTFFDGLAKSQPGWSC